MHYQNHSACHPFLHVCEEVMQMQMDFLFLCAGVAAKHWVKDCVYGVVVVVQEEKHDELENADEEIGLGAEEMETYVLVMAIGDVETVTFCVVKEIYV